MLINQSPGLSNTPYNKNKLHMIMGFNLEVTDVHGTEKEYVASVTQKDNSINQIKLNERHSN